MIRSVVKPKFVWSTNTPMRPRSDLAPGDGVISGIVPWGYMRSNRVIMIILPFAVSQVVSFVLLTHTHGPTVRLIYASEENKKD